MTVRPLFTSTYAQSLPVLDPFGVSNGTHETGIADVLGPERTTEIGLHPVPPAKARLLYVNYKYAKAAGLPVPRSHTITPALEKAALQRYALRTDGDHSQKPQTVTVDHYSGTEGNYGSGRGAFVKGNLFLKGIGKTPAVGNRADHSHSHGHAFVRGMVLEFTTLQVLDNLMDTSQGPVPVLIIGLDTYLRTSKWPGPEYTAIGVRAGMHIRPAHAISQIVYSRCAENDIKHLHRTHSPSVNITRRASHHWDTHESRSDEGFTPDKIDPYLFFRMAHAEGMLAFNPINNVADIKGTLQNMIKQLGRSCAEQMRWGIIHGTPSASNYELNGAILDSQTASSNPRRGRFRVLSYTMPFGAPEFRARLFHLQMIHESLRLNLTEWEKRTYNFPEAFDFAVPYNKAYLDALALEFLKAIGFKHSVAETLRRHLPNVTDEFRDCLYKLAQLENPGYPPMAIGPDGKLHHTIEEIEGFAVADVFNLLRYFPSHFFNRDRHTPINLYTVVGLLKPIYKDNPSMQGPQVKRLARDFIRLYELIMDTALEYHHSQYDGREAMKDAIVHRAFFENRPVEMYTWLRDEDNAVISAPNHETGERKPPGPELVTRMINEGSVPSFRNVGALYRQGEIDTDGNTLHIERQTIDHVSYSIAIDLNTGEHSLEISTPIVRTNDGKYTTAVFDDFSVTDPNQLTDDIYLSYDLYRSTRVKEAGAVIINTGTNNQRLSFRIHLRKSQNGLFYGSMRRRSSPDNNFEKDPKERLKRPPKKGDLHYYAFAVPDNRDLYALVKNEVDVKQRTNSQVDRIISAFFKLETLLGYEST
ncbi:MAG: hypothetical protein HQM16_03980 [Deltaproteobacteria bacterium]|nr:hypothetical protein [Deltaproteobacteria bacterium]